MDLLMASYTFLLVGKSTEAGWASVLKQALSPLGSLQVISEEDQSLIDGPRDYDVIIVDAGATREVAPLLSRLRNQYPEARLVVATASPTWRRAREAFRAGAADYIRKSMDERRLRSRIEAVLEL
jgi:DNA-binding NarL/FixJ family response regulator